MSPRFASESLLDNCTSSLNKCARGLSYYCVILAAKAGTMQRIYASVFAMLAGLCIAHAADVDSLLGKAPKPEAPAAAAAAVAEPFYVYG
jgi:hypothetical protein